MIKVQDIAYARFAAPDLDAMERFLTDFGLVPTARRDDRLYARGTDASPYVHVTEHGAPAFLGLAFEAGFGFLASDEIYLGDRENRVAAFLRCDLRGAPTDHHTLVCVGVFGGAEPGLDHVAFEVEDFDAVMLGHDHLKRAGYEHKMGVGRHILGGQVYDYWRDPWSHVVEHFTDGDLLDSRHETGIHDPSVALGSQWGTLAR